jgi:type VI protein secretion system component VasK
MLGKSAKAILYAIGLGLGSISAYLCWNEMAAGSSWLFIFPIIALCFFIIWCAACLLSMFLDHEPEQMEEEAKASKEAEGKMEEHRESDHMVTKNWESWWRY